MINNEIKEIKLKNMNNLAEYRKVLYENPKLRNIFIEVTLNCNANCEHCGSRCGSGKHEEEIDAKYLKKAFDSIAKKYNTKEILLSITGGEPLLRKDLFEIMDYAKKLGFQWGMTSNGMLITDNIIKKMEETQMDTISISLDGLKETHESFRKVPGSFDKIIENIKKLQKVPTIRAVQVTTVVNKKNINELEEMYKLMQDLNVISWRVINVDAIGNAKDNKDILLDKEDYKYLFNFIKEKRRENLLNVEFGCAHYLGIELEKELRDTYFICCAGIYIASILHNGDISVCPDVELKKELAQGNIKTDDFVDVWENKFQIFRTEKRTQNKKCQNCPSWQYCCGDAYHTWNFETGKPNFCIREIYEDLEI